MINQTIDCAKVSVEDCLANYCCTGVNASAEMFKTFGSPMIPILLFALIAVGIGAITGVVQEIRRRWKINIRS